MQNLRKIRKLNEQKAQRRYAATQLIPTRSKKLVESMMEKKSSQEQAGSDKMFLLKNLDDDKMEVVLSEEAVDKVLHNVSTLSEIDLLLERIWQEYLNSREREEEMFLEACYQGNMPLVKKVVEGKSQHPIDPRLVLTDEGKNGIHLATISGTYHNKEIIAFLVGCKVDLNGLTHNEKRTPLMMGCILGNDVAVEVLLKQGADVSLQDYEGNTALHLACCYNREKIVVCLLQNKCSIDIVNNKGQTPIECIASQQLYEYVRSKEPKIGYSQRAIVFEEGQPVAYRNNRKQDIDRLLHKIKQSSHISVCQSEKLDEDETNLQQHRTKTRKQHRQEKIQQVMIKQMSSSDLNGLSSFRKISILGRGAFGEVFLVENKSDNKQYAMKVLDKEMIMKQNILRYAMTERKILSAINHPFIVKLYYAFQTSSKLLLVMQYCPGGDLLRLVKLRGKLDEESTRKYAAEVILAVEELHKAEIIYRDLKPGNVVLDEQGHACITDFGLSKEAALAHSFCGSTAYLAPEMLWRRGHTKVLDWYLLGVFIYECLTGRPPFWDTSKQKLLANIKSGRYKPLGNQFSSEVQDLVEKLIRSNSSRRLGVHGAKQVKEHPWFGDINWQSVLNKEQVMEQIEANVGKPVKAQSFVEMEKIYNRISGWDYNYQ